MSLSLRRASSPTMGSYRIVSASARSRRPPGSTMKWVSIGILWICGCSPRCPRAAMFPNDPYPLRRSVRGQTWRSAKCRHRARATRIRREPDAGTGLEAQECRTTLDLRASGGGAAASHRRRRSRAARSESRPGRLYRSRDVPATAGLTIGWGGSEGHPCCVYDPDDHTVDAELHDRTHSPPGRHGDGDCHGVRRREHLQAGRIEQPLRGRRRTVQVPLRVAIAVEKAPHVDEDGVAACTLSVKY